MARSNITRTLGPIHFEDLDPRRFEDLVRELAYDFRDWQSIEATGRGGNDDGFDIRAYERAYLAGARRGQGTTDGVTTDGVRSCNSSYSGSSAPCVREDIGVP